MAIERWARGPFELLVHAEEHFRMQSEYDRRIALVNFDNAIEASVRTYVSLHPQQRNGLSISREQRQTANFHELLDTLFEVVGERHIPDNCKRTNIIHYHTIRNEQYHGGTLTVPILDDLEGAREAAQWVFAVLFNVPECADEVEARISEQAPKKRQPRRDLFDKVLDNAYGEIEIAEMAFPTSEALYAVDDEAYTAVAIQILEGTNEPTAEEIGDPAS